MVYDTIVLGTGGAGSAALYHLALRGVSALGIDRFPPGHDRGSSHGQTRIIRQAYFEHPDYVPMVLRAYELWRELEERSGEKLYYDVGLLQVGPPQGEVIPGVRSSAQIHGLELEDLSPSQVAARFPGFYVPADYAAAFERKAGYLRVEACVAAHARAAQNLGAKLHIGETALNWQITGDHAVVTTDRQAYRAQRLIITAGAWAGQLLANLGIPLEVRRKPLYWWRGKNEHFQADRGCPGYLYEVPEGCFYGFPQIDERGVKVAEHTGGPLVPDALALDRSLDTGDQSRVAAFIRQYLPDLTTDCLGDAVCMYTMTPDQNFIVDRHPQHPQVVFAAGLSGHGFKFTSMLGETLCELVLDGRTQAPIEFLKLSRAALKPREL